MNGNNIFISLTGSAVPFAATRSNEIQSECEMIEISSPNISNWRQYISGRKEWSFTVNWLVGNNSGVDQLLNVGTQYNIAIYKRVGNTNTKVLQGTALLKTCKINATRGNIASGSFQFVGNSALTAP